MSPSEINGRAPSIDLARPAISPRNLLRSGTPTAHERVALPLLPSGPGGVRRFSLRGAQPSTPPREAHSTRRSLERGFNPAVADCGLQGTATSPSSTATLYVPNGGEGGIRTHGTGFTRARHFQCRTFGRSVTSPGPRSSAGFGRPARAPGAGAGRRGEDLNPRGTFWAPIRFRVGRLQPGSATPPHQPWLRFVSKNCAMSARLSSPSTPPSTRARRFRRGSSSSRESEAALPDFGSGAPYKIGRAHV